MTLRLTWLLLLLPLVGCVTPTTRDCRKPQTPMIVETLYFGTESTQGPIASSAWQAFLHDTVTPRFPHGFTWWVSHGQWRDDSGRIVQERSYVLSIVRSTDQESELAINALATIYKDRFHQESILHTRTASCASF